MTESPLPENEFLTQLISVIEKNIANEQFGVSELADQLNMSRSNLLRKVKKDSKLSVSQLISQVRLKRAMELLRKTSQNVSEVAHQVGFNSPSYFIKCFREYYGYPPGEVGKRENVPAVPVGTLPDEVLPQAKPGTRRLAVALSVITIVAIAMAILLWPRRNEISSDSEKSIAILPFKNESNDSTNVYLVNGLMEATLTNLQKFQNLRVISRTSAEKYRNTAKSIPEMARELNVQYFVEGSGQKIGDRILLNIQLIDANTDRHLWAKQYRRESKDIFELQEEIARNIADEIELILTPEVEDKIEKKPTEDLVAYDYYLKGKDLFYRSKRPDLEASIPWFKKAIEKDPKFALAYATATMVYYYLDVFNLQKQYTREIENCADNAMLHDPKLSESHIAKALALAARQRYEMSIPYFEKALEIDPRSGLVLHFLTEFYNIHVPHPPKYLEYAIRKVKVDNAVDSITASFNYFHLSNALLQNGFPVDARRYIDKCLKLNPTSYFGGFLRAYIYYATDRNCEKARELLVAEWKKDTTRFDILQEVGKMSFMMRDYQRARACYDHAVPTMKMYGLDIFKHEYLRIAAAYAMTGDKMKAEEYVKEFKIFADADLTMYKDANLSGYYAYQKDYDKAIEYLTRFANQHDNFLYWMLIAREDPMFDGLKTHPGFDPAMKIIESKFMAMNKAMNERWGDDFKDL